MSDNIKSEEVTVILKGTFDCNICGKSLSSKSALNLHKKTAKYCLTLQGKEAEKKYACEICNKVFTLKDKYIIHSKKCNSNPIHIELENFKKKYTELEDINLKLEEKITNLEKDILSKDILISKHESKIDSLEKTISEIALKSVEKLVNVEKDSKEEKENTLKESKQEKQEEEPENQIVEYNKFKEGKLIFKGITIEAREDGMINATAMCKAFGKQFRDWNRLKETKALIEVLKSDRHICTSQIIQVIKGNSSKFSQGSWIHCDLAIQLAQWLSPCFALQVSKWIKELAIKGAVSIANEEILRKEKQRLQEKKRSKYLENKILKKQRRIQYKDSNVIYIVTTPSKEKEKIYKIGIAKNLTKRLSTYNSSEEHTVVYHQSCGTEEDMKLIEKLVFKKLGKYRKQANREIFQLKESEDVNIFINTIKTEIERLNE